MFKTKNVLLLAVLVLFLVSFGLVSQAGAVTQADIKTSKCSNDEIANNGYSSCEINEYFDEDDTRYTVKVACTSDSDCNSYVSLCEVGTPCKPSNEKINGRVDILSFIATGTASAPPIELAGKADHILRVLKIIVNILSGCVFVFAVIMLIVAGIQYSTAGGDPTGVKNAKSKITNVVIGLLAYVFLYAFLNWLIPGGVV